MTMDTVSSEYDLLLKGSRAARNYLYSRPQFEEEMQNVLTCSLTDWVKDTVETWSHILHQNDVSIQLRRDRRQLFLRCALRDLNGLADLSEVMEAWTLFADEAILKAAECAQQEMVTRYGYPKSEHNQEIQKLIVVGMGKLGGRELNVSSDVDLVLCYPESGQTDGLICVENREFFLNAAKLLFRLLDDRTQDGFVFRVDTRLRPDGVSGPQTISLAALEEYLLVRGRPWERHAWLKARALGADQDTRIRKLIDPFIFSRFLDFGALASLRDLHLRMLRDDSRRHRERDIKIGPGGIREIEFTIQLFQLIRGGQDLGVRSRSTRAGLRALAERGIIEPEMAQQLHDAYLFFRRLEHRIQYLDDAQTHRLPLPGPDLDFIALNMGFGDGAEMETEVSRKRQLVSEYFARSLGSFTQDKKVFAFSNAETPVSVVEDIWDALVTQDTVMLRNALIELAGQGGEDVQPFLEGLLLGKAWRSLSETGRRRYERLVQNALILSSESPFFQDTLRGILDIFNAIGGRETYFALLDEYPLALQHLAELSAASPWVVALLARFPSLLDELIHLHTLSSEVSAKDIQLELNRTVIPHRKDPESHLEKLRNLKQRFQFRLAVLEIKHLIPLQELSDRLSDLADACIAEALHMVTENQGIEGFSILAFGKLGGKEMGYRSDLDLVFIYDSDRIDSEKASRLAKRFLTGFSSPSGASMIYEIDVRLRPDGVSGFLVTSINAMRDYQYHRAQTWEHQALTRARFCAGDPIIGEQFEALRLQILSFPRDIPSLANQILAMRERMHQEHDVKIKGWDLKLSQGGLVDIEFMVQFLVLAYSHRYEGLLQNLGNVALLRYAASKQLIPHDLCEQVAQAYLKLRALQHRLELRGEPRDALQREDAEPNPSYVLNLWKTIFTPYLAL